MNAKTFIYSILLTLLTSASLHAQPLDEWKTFMLRKGLNAATNVIDSAQVSGLAYSICYGVPDLKQNWSVAQQIDSLRINTTVKRILEKPKSWQAELESLEPISEPYQALTKVVDSLIAAKGDSLVKWEKVAHTLNQFRLINRLPDDMVVLVNIPSAMLRVIDRLGNILLKCPVIVGSHGTPTPIFGAYLTRVITYPYWNVPRSIAVKEFLPKIKKNIGFLDAMNLQVISSQGQLVSAESINWKSLSARNFPYRLRQSTGCDNALGVIKFDLDSPYDVYLHDTNHRELFGRKYRFLSRGCIRVAEPVKLANLLMQRVFLAETYTNSSHQNIPSRSYPLPKTVPLVITYATVEAENGVTYYPDIYKKLRSLYP